MLIKLYKMRNETNTVSKTLTDELSLNCKLKVDCNILTPVIDIIAAGTGLTGFNIISTYNYAYIEALNRYYFVTNIVMLLGGITRLELKVDVLMTYKADLFNLSAVISRSAYYSNDMLVDEKIFTYYDNDVIEYDAPEPVNPTYNFTRFGTTKTPVLVSRLNWLAAGEGVSYIDDISTNNNVLPAIPVQFIAPEVYELSKGVCIVDDLLKLVLGLDTTTTSYVDSIYLYPFEIEKNSYSVARDIYLGSHRVGTAKGYGTKYPNSPYLTIADFTIGGNDSFLDYEPYTKYEIYLPYHNWIQLKACDILNNRLLVIYQVDYLSNTANVNVIDATNNKLLYSATCNLGTAFGLSTTNKYDIDNLRIANSLNMVLGSIGSGLKAGGDIASGKVLQGAGDIVGGVNSLAQGVIKENSLYTTASATVSSGNQGFMLPQKVRIRKTKIKTYKPDNYANMYGLPYRETMQLDEVFGYTEIEQIHLEGLTATKTEIDELESILKSGVFFPNY